MNYLALVVRPKLGEVLKIFVMLWLSRHKCYYSYLEGLGYCYWIKSHPYIYNSRKTYLHFREVLTPGVLYSRRFVTKTNKVPKWGEKFISGLVRRVPLVEESFVDSINKTITLYTRCLLFINAATIHNIIFNICIQV